MSRSTRKRKMTRIPRERQIDLFGGAAAAPKEALRHRSQEGRVFLNPDPHDIYLGNTPLKAHLREAGVHEPLVVRRLLEQQDWSAFEARYAPTGRAPYAPSVMMGLVLYGILQGVTSLRGLESLARRDLGCMWVSGGICPDHANIGRFIALHDDLIAGPFFEQLTRSVLHETGSSGESLAGDGTVVEAACSHYGLLKAEAARSQAEQAQREAEASPEDARKQQRATQARQAQQTLEERAAQRREQGKGHEQLCVSASEPEAMVQPLKRGRGTAPSYKPSILANEIRVVVAQGVHPSGEGALLPDLVNQSTAVTGSVPGELLLDAGYFNDRVIDTALTHEISLLCPESQQPGKAKESEKYYPKSQFHYDEQDDSYRCPAGARLIPVSRYEGSASSPGYTLYGTRACADCAQRDRCTRNRRGRQIKRYAGDTAKDALRQVMHQPEAKRRFSQRQSMVEPVFSVLRGLQGLNRFRRRGLGRVRTEFALHVLAYNLSRVLALRLYLGLYEAVMMARELMRLFGGGKTKNNRLLLPHDDEPLQAASATPLAVTRGL